MIGKVRKLMDTKGFGFIDGEDGNSYFFHFSALKNCKMEDLEVGFDVTFEETDGQKGPRAEEIYV